MIENTPKNNNSLFVVSDAFPNEHIPTKSNKIKKKKLNFKNFNPGHIFHNFFKKCFFKLGNLVAIYPSYFIMGPIFISLLGVTGFQKMYLEEDTEKLFYPTGDPAPYERSVIENHFPMNSSYSFIPYHLTRIKGFGRILIKAKDNGTIFRQHLWDELMLLDEDIRKLKINYEGMNLNYEDVCAMYDGQCNENLVLKLYPEIEGIENGSMKINYPVMLFPLVFPMFFGGVETDPDEFYITSAAALHLNYFLREDNYIDHKKAMLWEREFRDLILHTQFEALEVSCFTASSLQEITTDAPNAIKPYIPFTVALMIIFSMSNAMMIDNVRSKAFLGLVGVLSAVMGTITAFGFLMYAGVPFSGLNNIIPFLMIGIGLDDMFVVLAAWRRTQLQDDVRKRLSLTYAEAGVSVTITSLTNMISFAVGVMTPIMAVRIFCIYTALSILLNYIYHLTFFGGCLALSGRLEKEQRHSLTCVRVMSKSEAERENKGFFYIFCCTGGIDHKNPWNPVDNRPHVIMVFFRDYFGKMLTDSRIKGCVLFLFLLYLGGALYGCSKVTEGLDRRRVVRYDSPIVNYYDMEDHLFRQFPYQIQVVITGNIMYNEKSTQDKISELEKEFENLPYLIGGIFTRSWYKGWIRHLKRYPEVKANITSEIDFIRVLRERFLSGEGNPLSLDVEFNEDFSRITASRFILQSHNINDTNADKDMMLALRKVAEESSLNVTVFNPNFILFDQYVVVRPAVIQSTVIAAIAMIIISLLLIPNPWCSVLVGCAIVSIEVGVVGYMSFWNVSLDTITMVNLIMCIGFSVDFSAHVSYSYLTSKAKSSHEKVMECLFCLGLPILQGGLSTIASTACFPFVPSYAYIAFFKIVLLVVVLAGAHGLLFIPVLLSVVGPKSQKDEKEKEEQSNDSYSQYNQENKLTLSETEIPKIKMVGCSPENVETIITLRMDNISELKMDNISDEGFSDNTERADPEGCSNEEFSIEGSSNNEYDMSEEDAKSEIKISQER